MLSLHISLVFSSTVSQFIKWMHFCSAVSESVKLCPSSISNDICIYGVCLNIPFALNRNDLKQLYCKEKRNRKKKRTIRVKIKRKPLKVTWEVWSCQYFLMERLMVRVVVYCSRFLTNKYGLKGNFDCVKTESWSSQGWGCGLES